MPDHGAKWRILKGPTVIYHFELEPTASGTRVTMTVAYDTPPVLGGLPDPSFLRPVVIPRLEISWKYLKEILEGERPAES
jgi:hypothetical protein